MAPAFNRSSAQSSLSPKTLYTWDKRQSVTTSYSYKNWKHLISTSWSNEPNPVLWLVTWSRKIGLSGIFKISHCVPQKTDVLYAIQEIFSLPSLFGQDGWILLSDGLERGSRNTASHFMPSVCQPDGSCGLFICRPNPFFHCEFYNTRQIMSNGSNNQLFTLLCLG